MVQGKGVNDMPRGWRVSSKLNRRIYKAWQGMLHRCYSERLHQERPSYKGVEVCKRWLTLSNFVEDIIHLEGYTEWAENKQKMALDKDIKGNDCKIYSPDTCKFVTYTDNTKECNSRMSSKKPVVRISKDSSIKEYPSVMATEKEGFHNGHVVLCCQGKQKNIDGCT